MITSNSIGYAGLHHLRRGDHLLYRAGQGEYHVEADVQVNDAPGSTGVMVRINRIRAKGAKAPHAWQGAVILAGALELYKA